MVTTRSFFSSELVNQTETLSICSVPVKGSRTASMVAPAVGAVSPLTKMAAS